MLSVITGGLNKTEPEVEECSDELLRGTALKYRILYGHIRYKALCATKDLYGNHALVNWFSWQLYLLDVYSAEWSTEKWAHELDKWEQGSDETVSSYTKRIIDIYTTLKDRLFNVCLTREEYEASSEYFRLKLGHTIVNGFREDIISFVFQLHNPTTIEDTISIACSIELECVDYSEPENTEHEIEIIQID